MNQLLAGSFALILALVLWGLGKNPQKSLRKVSKIKLLDSNREQISLLKTYSKPQAENIEKEWEVPKTQAERINLRRKLFRLISNGPEERLVAVQIAANWGDKKLLPILRRGLKDSDSRIVITAAQGIQKHRKFQKLSNTQFKEPLPRNIFLMR